MIILINTILKRDWFSRSRRKFEQLGEARKKISVIVTDLASNVPNARRDIRTLVPAEDDASI